MRRRISESSIKLNFTLAITSHNLYLVDLGKLVDFSEFYIVEHQSLE